MTITDITSIIIEEAIYIHKKLGPGLLENVYKHCLGYRVTKRGLLVEIEKPLPVVFEDVKLDCGYRLDHVVERKVIVEIKTVEFLTDLHRAQLLTYLKFANLRYGLLLNFNSELMKDGIKRIVNGY